MYMDLQQEDPEKNRKRGWVVFLLCVAFLIGITQCAKGQNCIIRDKPFDNHKEITRLTSCQGIRYESNGKDVFLNIFADSMNIHNYSIRLYLFITKGTIVENPNLVVSYEDGEMQDFIFVKENSVLNYVEFLPKENGIEKLRDKKINYINFTNSDIDYVVFEEKVDIFYNFIRGL